MAISIAAGSQVRPDMPQLVGTATGYSETVTATGALDVLIPHSAIEILGTATTVIDTYTLGTGPYEGYTKYVTTEQSATDGVGIAKVELANAVGDPAQQVVSIEFPSALMLKWINDRWIAFDSMTQGAAAAMSTATT